MTHVLPSLDAVRSRFPDAVPRGIYIVHLEEWDDDRSLRCVYGNPATEMITGVPVDHYIGRLMDDTIPRLRETGLTAAFAEVIRVNQQRSFGDIVYGDDRVITRTYSVNAYPLGDQCAAIVLENVTERRRIEAARKEVEQRYAELFHHSIDAIIVTEAGKVVAANPAACALMGYSEEEFMGRRRDQIVSCDDHEVQRMVHELNEIGRSSGDMILVRKDGSSFPAEISAYQYPSLSGLRNSISIRDISDRVAAKELSRQHELILNSVSDGILGTGADGRLTFLNPAASRILGYAAHDFAEKPIHELIHRTAALRHEKRDTAEDSYWRADGSSVDVEYSSMPMLDEDGTLHGAVLTFRDITERRAIERLKNEFVSTVSHELRTPLTSIHGALRLLGSGLLGSVNEKAQRMLDIATSNTQRLVRLINEILDLERIESRTMALTRTDVSVETLMKHAIDGVYAIAVQSNIALVAEITNATLSVDSDRILQTLTNLLGNAIKFSSAGTTVTLSGIVGDDEFTFCVADRGRGVPDDKKAAVFERFQQVDASDSRTKGGTGLGLAICKSIVNAHGGRIWIEKNGDQGSVFLFTVPMQEDGVDLVSAAS